MLSSDPKRLKRLGIDLRPRWRRRVIVYLTYFIYVGVIFLAEGRNVFPSERVVDWFVSICVIFFSIFGIFSPLKSFGDVPIPAGGRLIGKKVMLGSLDDWAKYRYGNIFDQTSPEEQKELLRTYRVGNYLLPFKSASGFDPRVPDERELAEINAASKKALQYLLVLLLFSAVSPTIWQHQAAEIYLILAVLAATLSKAIVLCEERDPRANVEPEPVEQK
ncbi:MAG: hypothetical protein ABR990_08595 [Terracidiphilus sp.]|jgi:hypothetical protein